MGAVCHYFHLNPVRAGILEVNVLPKWPWTSVPALMNPRQRAAWFSLEAALSHAGGLKDTPAGRMRYLAYLAWLHEDDVGKKELQFDRLSKDWAVGTREFKKELVKQHQQLEAVLDKNESGPRELAQELWTERLAVYLAALGKTARDIRGDAKAAPWKVALAAAMKATTTASNPWLAQRLNMRSPFRLSRLATRCRADPSAFQPHVKIIAERKV